VLRYINSSPFTTCFTTPLSAGSETFVHLTVMASNALPKLNYTPVSVQGVVEVNGRFGGWNPIDSLRGFFTIDGQVEEGDYFMDRSRHLLEKHLQMMDLEDQTNVRNSYKESDFQRLCRAAV
jgi:hypothetical protein